MVKLLVSILASEFKADQMRGTWGTHRDAALWERAVVTANRAQCSAPRGVRGREVLWVLEG